MWYHKIAILLSWTVVVVVVVVVGGGGEESYVCKYSGGVEVRK